MVKICQCCGHPLPEYGVRAVLTNLQLRIFDAVAHAGQAGIPAQRIMDVVYADDPSGGPESHNIIAVVRRQMEPQLMAYGLKIKTRRGPGSPHWTLEKL